MSSHDPYAPASRGGARRRTMDPPPDPAADVPGHEDAAIAWMRDGDTDEQRRRRRLVEQVENAREGGPRDAVVAAVVEDDDAADAEGKARRRQPENDGRGADQSGAPAAGVVQQPDESEVAGEYTADDVPATAVDAARWIRDGANEADKHARAVVAMDVERQRPDGVRGTVEAAANAHGVG